MPLRLPGITVIDQSCVMPQMVHAMASLHMAGRCWRDAGELLLALIPSAASSGLTPGHQRSLDGFEYRQPADLQLCECGSQIGVGHEGGMKLKAWTTRAATTATAPGYATAFLGRLHRY
jgi:hypothetical protein